MTPLQLPSGHPIDWGAKLRHMAQTWVFCLAIALLQVAFTPERAFLPPLVYSLCIGTITWAGIDLGRHAFASSRETGWPGLAPGLALVVGSILAGYLGGTTLADALCRTFGWYTDGLTPDRGSDSRTAILITTMAGIVGSYYFYSINRARYLERKAAEARRHAEDARLKLLETQLEPHMMFNTLANLRALIGVDPPRAQQMLDHMIAYLRSTLDASRHTTHTVRTEFDRLRDYLELMAIRMGPRLSFELDLPESLAAHPVPTLLLQPLVENAIKHGLEPHLGGGRIDVGAREEGGRLVLEVVDTGTGLGGWGGPPPVGSGFGLAQVRDRLAALYGDAAQLTLEPRESGGTRARIRLPLQRP